MSPDLARELVAAYPNICEPGMLVDLPACGTMAACKARLVHAPHFGGLTGYRNGGGLTAANDGTADLADPATAGVLLARLAGIVGAVTVEVSPEYAAVKWGGMPMFFQVGEHLGEALARALIAVRA